MNAENKVPVSRIENRISFHLDGRSVSLDRRINAVRGDLADISLAGVLFAPHYAKAEAMQCSASAAFLRESGAHDASAVSQLLHGEIFHVLDVTGDWAWGFCDHDAYVGYIERSALDAHPAPTTHRVIARTAPLFAQANIKSPVIAQLPAGSLVGGQAEGDFLATAQGYLHMRHALFIAEAELDWVAEAEKQIGQPYVWGGRGAGGIDCSGLIQLALGQAGVRVPRDSDMQRESIGEAMAAGDQLQRGDLIFFPGHVGIMTDAEHMLHANAYWMNTVIEPLADVIIRLKADHAEPVLARRRIML